MNERTTAPAFTSRGFLYHSAHAARAAARVVSEELERKGAPLPVYGAGALVVPDVPAPSVAVRDAAAEELELVPEELALPLPHVVPEGVAEPEPLPAAWPGERFSVAFAASAEKA